MLSIAQIVAGRQPMSGMPGGQKRSSVLKTLPAMSKLAVSDNGHLWPACRAVPTEC